MAWLRPALVAAFCASLTALAQTDAGEARRDIADVSLEELLETKVSVASASGATVSAGESPGVVTVITREEIHDMGARDLIDVLRFVPGFDFSNDVENTVGLTVRGIWALEGKALVLIDGMPYNDLEYGNVLFGNRAPVDLIERIEIIRGPGSTIYGGFAALAVVNVILRPEKPGNRLLASTTYGQMPTAVGRFTASLAGSHSFGELNIHASAFTGYTIRSDRPYVAGDTVFNLAEQSHIRPLNLAVGADWRGLSFNLMYDDYFHEAPLGEAPEAPLKKEHRNLFAQLRWVKPLNDFVSISAWARYWFSVPWQGNTSRDLELSYYSDKRIHRAQAGASATVRPLGWLSVLAGVEATYDTAIAVEHGSKEIDDYNAYVGLDGTPTHQLSFFNFAAFAEATAVTPVVNIVAGARFDYHTVYGPVVVPRVALTKEIGGFHAKALAARAFRAPVFENISYGKDPRPEYINVFEVEAGYQFAPWLYAGINLFDNRVSPTLVYQEVGLQSLYVNGGTTGTHGLEVELRSKGSWGYVVAAYSFYEATVRGVEQFLVEGHPELFLGAPQHRFAVRGAFRIGPYVSFNPAFIVYSERYGLETALHATDPVVTKFGPTVVADLFLVLRNVGIEGFDLGVGVHDATGSNYRYVPAYNAGINALPAPGTEVMLRLSYLRDSPQ